MSKIQSANRPADLQNPVFTDENKAREAFEAVMWPNGPVCPHCGCTSRIGKVEGESHRPGLYYCGDCKKQFTATVGTIFERSKVPLTKWWLASHLLSASKKGMSSVQLSRMLGVTQKTAWFMNHRIREAMTPAKPAPIGGENKVVETDETYVGGKAKNRKNKIPAKRAVVSLVERGGEVRTYHVANVNAETLRPIMVKIASRQSYLMTDESPVYWGIGKEFAGHGSVNHSAEEYVRGVFWHTNTVENYFSIFKRGIYGVYHHVSVAHLSRYTAEFDVRYNSRSYSDAERTQFIMRGASGKRLTYRPTDAQAGA